MGFFNLVLDPINGSTWKLHVQVEVDRSNTFCRILPGKVDHPHVPGKTEGLFENSLPLHPLGDHRPLHENGINVVFLKPMTQRLFDAAAMHQAHILCKLDGLRP